MKIQRTALTPVQVQASRFDLLSRLADDLAHEIKNPLHAMVINLEVLKRRVHNGDHGVALERAEVIGQEIQRVHLLVDQILQLLRPSREAPQLLYVDQVIDELLPLLEARARLNHTGFRLEPAGDGARACVRRDALKFGILAAVERALACAGPGGEVAVIGSFDAQSVRLHVQGTPASVATVVPAPGRHVAVATGTQSQPDFVDAARALLQENGGSLEAEPASSNGAAGCHLITVPRQAGA